MYYHIHSPQNIHWKDPSDKIFYCLFDMLKKHKYPDKIILTSLRQETSKKRCFSRTENTREVSIGRQRSAAWYAVPTLSTCHLFPLISGSLILLFSFLLFSSLLFFLLSSLIKWLVFGRSATTQNERASVF